MPNFDLQYFSLWWDFKTSILNKQLYHPSLSSQLYSTVSPATELNCSSATLVIFHVDSGPQWHCRAALTELVSPIRPALRERQSFDLLGLFYVTSVALTSPDALLTHYVSLWTVTCIQISPELPPVGLGRGLSGLQNPQVTAFSEVLNSAPKHCWRGIATYISKQG